VNLVAAVLVIVLMPIALIALAEIFTDW